MPVNNLELIDNNPINEQLSSLWEFIEWRFRIAEFTCWLDENETNWVCKIFDKAFNLQTELPQNNIA